MKTVLLIVLCLAIGAGGVWWWDRAEMSALETRMSGLNESNRALLDAVDTLKTELASRPTQYDADQMRAQIESKDKQLALAQKLLRDMGGVR